MANDGIWKMKHTDEDRLKEVFIAWIEETIDAWVGEYTAWDNLIEDGTITEEEWKWIANNLKITKIEVDHEL